jgi:glycine/D-amino acid oxidase-like deaminating enzyme
MGPEINPVESDTLLPSQTDVVVIGGGVIGLTSALFLAERGVKVVLLEKGEIAC